MPAVLDPYLMLFTTTILVVVIKPWWGWLGMLGLGALQALDDPYWVWLCLGILIPLKLILIRRERRGPERA